MYNLGRNPHVQEKLYQEIENVVGKEEDVTSQSLAKLSYLKACVKESLRWHVSSIISDVQYTLFQNGRNFGILLFTCKLALVASF